MELSPARLGAIILLAVLASPAYSSGNTAPTITGTPPASVTVGDNYWFRPTARDRDGDALIFRIRSKPSWARFNRTTGRLRGTPQPGDEGTYDGIAIVVSDGIARDSIRFTITVNPADGGGSGNSAPTIGGTPPTSVKVADTYWFRPAASDPDGDTLTFSIQAQPPWANFNPTTGRLSGTPQAGDEGVYDNISIEVSDGTASDSLAFSITVNQVEPGSVELSWLPPTQNTDGSALTDLAGYKIYYGTTPGNYTEQIHIDNPSINTYVVENLSPDTYYFVVTSINSSGVESGFSGILTRTLD